METSDVRPIAVIIPVLLVLFGILYDWFAGWMGRRYPGHVETALLVVGGVGVTLVASAFLIGLYNAFVVFGLFAASGLPMVIGDKARRYRSLRGFADAFDSIRHDGDRVE